MPVPSRESATASSRESACSLYCLHEAVTSSPSLPCTSLFLLQSRHEVIKLLLSPSSTSRFAFFLHGEENGEEKRRAGEDNGNDHHRHCLDRPSPPPTSSMNASETETETKTEIEIEIETETKTETTDEGSRRW